MTSDELAQRIMGEGSVANLAELTALGFACQRNPLRAPNKSPTELIKKLAILILEGQINDRTQGANRWFSPILMPVESQNTLCRAPIGNGTLDCDGGLDASCGIPEHYTPGWATPDKQVSIPGVRPCYYKFFKL